MTPLEALALLAWDLEPDGRGPLGRLVQAGGETFHILEAGDGPPTIFLHGGGPGCTGWSDFGQVTPLFGRDRRVLLVDLLQYGRSSKPHIEGPMWDFHVERLVALLDVLSITRASFVCNSWGGTMALCLASRHPERVDALVITGSMPVFHGPTSPLIDRSRRGRLAREEYYGGDGPTWLKMRALMERFEWYDGSSIPESTVDVRYQQSLEQDEIDCGQVPEHRGEWQDLTAHLAKVTCPTLFVWGMYDAFLTPDYALMLANMVVQGNVHVMSKSSHHMQEEWPERYHAVVHSFLRSDLVGVST